MGYILGADPTAVFTVAEMQSNGRGFGPGDRYTDHEGREFVFVQFGTGGATGPGYVCIFNEAYAAVMASLTTSDGAFGDLVGVAQAAAAATNYGWVQVKGPCNIRVNAAAAANTALNTTGTDGQLDDNAGSGSEVINNLILTTTAGGAAGLAPGVVNYPSVGATL